MPELEFRLGILFTESDGGCVIACVAWDMAGRLYPGDDGDVAESLECLWRAYVDEGEEFVDALFEDQVAVGDD